MRYYLMALLTCFNLTYGMEGGDEEKNGALCSNLFGLMKPVYQKDLGDKTYTIIDTQNTGQENLTLDYPSKNLWIKGDLKSEKEIKVTANNIILVGSLLSGSKITINCKNFSATNKNSSRSFEIQSINGLTFQVPETQLLYNEKVSGGELYPYFKQKQQESGSILTTRHNF